MYRPHPVHAPFTLLTPSAKTFRKRLPEVIDQAQHFASLQGTTGGSSRGGDATVAAFREGMDGTERECVYYCIFHRDCLTISTFFRL